MKRKQRREGVGGMDGSLKSCSSPPPHDTLGRSYLGEAVLGSAFIYFSLCSQLISTVDQTTLGQEACSHRATSSPLPRSLPSTLTYHYPPPLLSWACWTVCCCQTQAEGPRGLFFFFFPSFKMKSLRLEAAQQHRADPPPSPTILFMASLCSTLSIRNSQVSALMNHVGTLKEAGKSRLKSDD